MRSSVLLASVLVAGIVGGCAESPVTPDEGTPPTQPPAFVGEPSNFVGSTCIVDSVDGNGDFFVHWDFTWTAGQTGTWEISRSNSSGGTKIIFATDTIGTSWVFDGGPAFTPPGTTKNRWFWIRSALTGGGWSNWVPASNNPIDTGGPTCMA